MTYLELFIGVSIAICIYFAWYAIQQIILQVFCHFGTSKQDKVNRAYWCYTMHGRLFMFHRYDSNVNYVDLYFEQHEKPFKIGDDRME